MKSLILCIFVILFFSFSLSNITGLVSKGSANSKDGFAFLDRFCFESYSGSDGNGTTYAGIVEFTIELDPSIVIAPNTIFFNLYDDEPAYWPRVMNLPSTATCMQKQQLRKPEPRTALQFIDGKASGSVSIDQVTRPRYWLYLTTT